MIGSPRSTARVRRRSRERLMSIVKRDLVDTGRVGHLVGYETLHRVVDYHGVLLPTCNPFPRGTARELIIDPADAEVTCKRCG